MLNVFEKGGWGMYPTLFCGLFLLGAAVQFARRPHRSGMTLLWVLSSLTFVVGLLGFVTGFIRTLHGAASAPRINRVIAMGTSESLHNIALALCLIIAATIAIAVGVARMRRQTEGQ